MFFAHGDAVIAKDQQALAAPLTACDDPCQSQAVGRQQCPFDSPQSVHRHARFPEVDDCSRSEGLDKRYDCRTTQAGFCATMTVVAPNRTFRIILF
jgi:hypothetical protein